MPAAISIADAVDLRNCDLTGCETCPFRVYTRPDRACMLPGGITALLALPPLARMLGQDEARARALINDELELASDVHGHDYGIASVEQTKELAQRLEQALQGLRSIVKGPADEVDGEWVERVQANLGPWIEDWPNSDGRRTIKLLQMHVELEIAARFIESAVRMGAQVEFDRWDVPRDS